MFRFQGGKFILAGMIGFVFLWVGTVQANVTIKLLGVNPSEEKMQIVKLRAYLPQEVTLEDVIDHGDMNIAYDISKGAYQVFKDYEVEPGDNVEREIIIKDIWIFPEEKLNNLRGEINKTIDFIRGTEFEEQAEFLRKSMDEKLNKITERQKTAASNPQQHISYYRENKELFNSAKEDLLLARSFMSQGKRLSAVKIWKLFIWVVLFLAGLGASLYFVWRKQFKMMKHSPSGSGEDKEMIEVVADEPKIGKHDEVSVEDIEDMIRVDE